MASQVSIDIEFTHDAIEGGFELVCEVLAVTGGMEDHVFLFESKQKEFLHVVRPNDLNWPESRDLAKKAYRSDQVTLEFSSMENLLETQTRIENDIQEIVDAFANNLPSFLGSETKTFSPS